MSWRTLVISTLLAAGAVGATAGTAEAATTYPNVCVKQGIGPSKVYACPSGWPVVSTVTAAVGEVAAGGSIQIEPGTYDEEVPGGPVDVRISGDPAVNTRPVVTFAGEPEHPTWDIANGTKLTHLVVNFTGVNGRAINAEGAATLNDVSIATTLECGVFNGAATLINVTATNEPSSAYYCLTFRGGVDNTITDSSIISTRGILASAALDVERSTISASASSAVDEDEPLTAHHSTFSGVGDAISMEDGGQFGDPGGHGSATLDNSLVTATGTTANTGALELAWGATATLRNVTAVATGAGAAVSVFSQDASLPAASASITNSILRGPTDLWLEPLYTNCTTSGSTTPCAPSQATVSHSDLRTTTGFTDAGGNVTGDPRFVNGTLGTGQDFHLQAGSPAVDSGAAVPTGDLDLDGNPRPQAGTTADMGAYEGPVATPTPTATATPGPTPSATPSATATPTPTTSPTPTATPTTSPAPTPTPTPTPSVTPTPTATATPTPSANPAPTATPTPAPDATPTPTATLVPGFQSTLTGPPIVTPPSNAFSLVGKPKAGKDGTITLVEKPVAAGAFTVTATIPGTVKASTAKTKAKAKKPLPVSFGQAGTSSGAGQAATLVLRPSKSAKSAIKLLKGNKTLTVTIQVSFLPTGGTTNTATLTVKIAAPTKATTKRH